MVCGFLLLHKRNSFWNVVDVRDVFAVSEQIAEMSSIDGFAQAVDVEGRRERPVRGMQEDGVRLKKTDKLGKYLLILNGKLSK